MVPKVYIDGDEPVGARLRRRLIDRRDVELLLIDGEKRKDLWERKRMMDAAALVFLALPEEEAAEIVELAEKPGLKVVDLSAAHRLSPGWAYGFPELSRLHAARVRSSPRVAMPGPLAAGLVAVLYPLVSLSVLPADCPAGCLALTGADSAARILGPDRERGQAEEARAVCSLTRAPALCAAAGGHSRGTAVTVTLPAGRLHRAKSPAEIRSLLAGFYRDAPLVAVAEEALAPDPAAMAGRDGMVLSVREEAGAVAVAALYDELGRGGAGGAERLMDLALGLGEAARPAL